LCENLIFVLANIIIEVINIVSAVRDLDMLSVMKRCVSIIICLLRGMRVRYKIRVMLVALAILHQGHIGEVIRIRSLGKISFSIYLLLILLRYLILLYGL